MLRKKDVYFDILSPYQILLEEVSKKRKVFFGLSLKIVLYWKQLMMSDIYLFRYGKQRR